MDMTVPKDYGTTLQEMKSRMASIKRKAGVSRTKSAQKKKKRLKYNSREISGQLVRATKAVGAGQVLIRAKGKVAQLQRCAATGDYDSKEMSAALNHANRMVKAAKMKVKHLKSEERIEKKSKKSTPHVRMKEEQREKQLIQLELKKIRRKHRGAEEKEIRDAQLRYLRERSSSSTSHTDSAESRTAAVSAAPEVGTEIIENSTADLSAGAVGMSVDVCL